MATGLQTECGQGLDSEMLRGIGGHDTYSPIPRPGCHCSHMARLARVVIPGSNCDGGICCWFDIPKSSLGRNCRRKHTF